MAKKITITIEVYDAEVKTEDIERIVGHALNDEGIWCYYDVEENKE